MRNWKFISAAVAILGEGALQLSGYTNIPLAIFLGLLAVGFFVWGIWPFLSTMRIRSPIETITNKEIAQVKDNKLTLVVKAIMEAKQITPKEKAVTVYISDANGLTQIYAEELKDILLKLQDEKALVLKTFPDWLLSSPKLTKKAFHESVLAAMEPSRKNFTVCLLKEFKRFTKRH